MSLIATALLSLLSSLLPDVVRLFSRKQDYEHEYRMMDLQKDLQAQQNLHRVDMAELHFAEREVEAVHQAQPSSAVELLRALQKASWMRWYTAPVIIPALYLFVAVDWLNNALRPVMAAVVCGVWVAWKFQQLQATGGVVVMAENDWVLLFTVVGFFFGSRQLAKRLK